jgi:phosphoesterase RecJ-like protein
MTDTGNFSYNSTNCDLYEIVAALIRAGVKKDEIYNAVFNQYSTDRMRLLGYALYRKMRIYPEHHLALITLTADELDRYHYQPGDCEGLVNMPLQIADVYYSVFMREERAKPGTPKPRIRISFRSQGDRPVNVWANEVFHGGGHMNASGGELFGRIEQAVALFEQTYKKYLKI